MSFQIVTIAIFRDRTCETIQADPPILTMLYPFQRLVLIALTTAIAAPAQAQLSPEAVAAHLEGVMTTAEQAAVDPNFVSVRMTTCRVTVPDATPDAANSIYLYQEQALSNNLAEPYRQRFLQIVPGEDQRIESRSFKPESPEPWVGLCDRADRQVPTAALGELICTVALRESVLGYVGSTPAAGCPASFRGAASITNVVVLHDDGMDTWDRGFDAAGEQLWGADGEPYRYRWLAE
ncbi:MAG: chorismate mutase [Leptolyngbya sp. SIO4C1]|nr:chorismate mutase [Leptolyngbya sp. SIO4C1]